MNSVTLILGGARSGKSSYAQSYAESRSNRPVYIATAEAGDDEMRRRISQHQAERGDQWSTVECPLHLAELLTAQSADTVLVVDCLTLWLSNHLLLEADLQMRTDKLVEAINLCPAELILVSNEVGMGLVPDNALGREFRDAQGRLNQQVAAAAKQVVFVAAGLPLALKGEAPL